jgi:hypothetical protein
VRPDLEHRLQPYNRFDDRDRDGLLVARCRAGATQYFIRPVIGKIGDDCLKSLPRQPAQRGIGVQAQFHFYLKIAQHAPQHSYDLFVRTQQQGFKAHGSLTTELRRCLHWHAHQAPYCTLCRSI